MSCIYFLSDLHVAKSPDHYPIVLDFFERVRTEAESLYILGDFFECWWGDDHNYEPYAAWEKFFAHYPVPIYFLPGNRDFLCGSEFYARTKWIPITAGHIISFGGLKIALFHGDEPGLQDWPYQIFRKIIRSPLKNLLLKLPPSMRQSLAFKARQRPSALRRYRPLSIQITQWLHQCAENPNRIVHGHLHQPLIQKYPSLVRYQLGCWDCDQYSFLRIDSDGSLNLESSCATLYQD